MPDRSHAELGPAGPQWRLRECYPSIGDSQKLGARLPLAFLFVNPSFVLLGGAVAFALSWGVQVGLMKSRINFAGVMRTVSLLGVRDGFSSSPIAILIGLGVVGAMTMFAKKAKAAWSGHGNIFRNALVARVVGALHGVAQVVGALAVCAGVAYVLRPVGRDGVFNVLFTLLVAIAGGVAAGAIMGVYLYLANLVGMHDNEAFSALHLSGYKNFLRMHIGRGGQLTIYALKIEGVPPPRRWFDRVAGAANRHGEQLVTVSDELGHCPVELIEKVDVVSVEVEQLSSSGQA
ncbi:MAG: hypothetical protein ACXV95_12510 [Acidimicrobiales bacterium]